MSLKHVHTAFIVAAMALAVVCASQAWAAFQDAHSPAAALATAGSVGAAVLLMVYERRFLARCRREGIR